MYMCALKSPYVLTRCQCSVPHSAFCKINWNTMQLINSIQSNPTPQVQGHFQLHGQREQLKFLHRGSVQGKVSARPAHDKLLVEGIHKFFHHSALVMPD